MSIDRFYPVGTPGLAWNNSEKTQWLNQANQIQRSYKHDVIDIIHNLSNDFSVHRYGALTHDPDRYQLYCLKSAQWNPHKPTVLITGGVHGYEKSGVMGAIDFLLKHAADFSNEFNFLVFPCVSPWGYETINRWNPQAIDPNRSFYSHSPCEEASNLLHFIQPYLSKIVAHFDLHETTDTDNSIFIPAAAARDGGKYHSVEVPDGFYVVANSEKPELEFQTAIVDTVAKITHIAEADEHGRLFGSRLKTRGVVLYAMKPLGLCGSLTPCKYHATTEVYPDSPKIDDKTCVQAQVTAIRAGLAFLLSQR